MAEAQHFDPVFYSQLGFGSRDYEAYHLRLGQLMHAFTMAEMWIGSSISEIVTRELNPTSTDPNINPHLILSALFIGRAGPQMDALRRLLRNLNAPQNLQDELGAILSHFASIQSLRDHLAHRRVIVNGDRVEIDSIYAAKEAKQIISRTFTLSVLEDATFDLLILREKLRYLLNETIKPDANAEPLVSAPWRYKPVQPDRT